MVLSFFLVFPGGRQRFESFPNNDVTGRTDAGYLAGVLDKNSVVDQVPADRFAFTNGIR
jgi:hypothetical protein